MNHGDTVSEMDKKTKKFIVRGNLQNKLSYKFLPYELSHGSWFIRIISLTYAINGSPVQSTCSITCNLVTSRENSNNIIINSEQPLGLLLFDIKTKRKIVTYNEQWLNINVYSDELILSLVSLEINEKLTIDCDLFFLMQIYQKE